MTNTLGRKKLQLIRIVALLVMLQTGIPLAIHAQKVNPATTTWTATSTKIDRARRLRTGGGGLHVA